MRDTGKPICGCPVMELEELLNLEDLMTYDRSDILERQVREQAERTTETCRATGKPVRCYFMAPLSVREIADGDKRVPETTGAVEVTVDIRGATGYAAVLIAEEQIRRQMAKLPWAKLPDLAASRPDA